MIRLAELLKLRTDAYEGMIKIFNCFINEWMNGLEACLAVGRD
jgi:hypothetical protein